VVQILWLTPAMDRLFLEGRSERRAFLDRLVFGFDAGHARRVYTLRDRDARACPPAQIRSARSGLARRSRGPDDRDRARHRRLARRNHRASQSRACRAR
jgi:hypothetical protein